MSRTWSSMITALRSIWIHMESPIRFLCSCEQNLIQPGHTEERKKWRICGESLEPCWPWGGSSSHQQDFLLLFFLSSYVFWEAIITSCCWPPTFKLFPVVMIGAEWRTSCTSSLCAEEEEKIRSVFTNRSTLPSVFIGQSRSGWRRGVWFLHHPGAKQVTCSLWHPGPGAAASTLADPAPVRHSDTAVRAPVRF